MKLSIITINLNNAEGLQRTIESVVSQTFTDYEYIIIDGGSTDGSVDIIKQYAEKFTYWVSEPDKGIYNAMNKGIAIAKGEYCNFMNSGDWFYDNNVLTDVFCRNIDVGIIIGNTLFVNDKKTTLYKSGFLNKCHKITFSWLYNHTICHQATFIKREILCKFPYDESKRIVSDYKFFIETLILNDVDYAHVDNIICYFEGG
ncbi:MAG: glycosyltransferase, partial [Candidatus Symbiothrix sp.]|nr:glycosyltransferase [Candidatus Symbiothrix sp.]